MPMQMQRVKRLCNNNTNLENVISNNDILQIIITEHARKTERTKDACSNFKHSVFD